MKIIKIHKPIAEENLQILPFYACPEDTAIIIVGGVPYGSWQEFTGQEGLSFLDPEKAAALSADFTLYATVNKNKQDILSAEVGENFAYLALEQKTVDAARLKNFAGLWLKEAEIATLGETVLDGFARYTAQEFFSHGTKADLLITGRKEVGEAALALLSPGKHITICENRTAFYEQENIFFALDILTGRVQKTFAPYHGFAKYYDAYMSHVGYDEWVTFILECYNKLCRKSPEEVLELACGTGNIAWRLVKKGLNVDASDLATEMLVLAGKKHFAPNLRRADMLSPLAKEYDLILLLFDSINYLADKADIKKLLANVYAGLHENGVFIFDISTEANCLENFDGFVNLEDDETEYLIHTAEYDKVTNTQFSRLTFFKKEGNVYFRHEEVHKQHIFKVEELVTLINETSFNVHGIYTIENERKLKITKNIDQNHQRLFFVLQK